MARRKESGVRRASGAAEAVAASSGMDNPPPSTNRGGEKPNGSEVTGKIDYLKLTVWNNPSDVAFLLRDVWLAERVNLDDWGLDWIDLGPAKRIANRQVLGVSGIAVLEYRESDFVGVELKGEACSLAGDELLQDLLRLIGTNGARRWHGVRVDYAWDGVPFSVDTVRRAIERGAYSSRCRSIVRAEYLQNNLGHTVYFPRAHADRFVRVYDMRGPVRCELQLGGEFAKTAALQLRDTPPAEWSALMMSHLRSLVEFVEAKSNNRRSRCELAKWWAKFVEGSVRAARCSVREDRQAHALARLHCAIDRARRAFVAGLDAFDDKPEEFIEWWRKQCEKGAARESAEHVAWVRDLRRLRGSVVGPYGWTAPRADEEEPPF